MNLNKLATGRGEKRRENGVLLNACGHVLKDETCKGLKKLREKIKNAIGHDTLAFRGLIMLHSSEVVSDHPSGVESFKTIKCREAQD